MDGEEKKESLWNKLSVSLFVLLIIFVCITGFVLDESNKIKVEYSGLLGKNNVLMSDFNTLKTKYSVLENDYKNLDSRYAELKNQYDSQIINYNNLRSEYDNLRGQSSTIQSNYQSLESENKRITNLLNQYEKVPQGYYTTSPFKKHENTLDELRIFLSNEFKLPKSYEVNIFDCSESSAYLEWALDNAGFDANIATGKTPWNQTSGYHAWVIVSTNDPYKVAIESTVLTGGIFGDDGIVYGNDKGSDNYYNGYDTLDSNIYLTIKDNGFRDWNWWEGYWGFI